MNKQLLRRNFLRMGIGAAGTMAMAPAIARICAPRTADQPLGPFFPRPGTPFDPIREDHNPNTPISLANDSDLTKIVGREGQATGQVVHISGIIYDKDCRPIENATIVIWQASHSGRYNHKGDSENQDFRHPRTGGIIKRIHDPSFQYWGRATSGREGQYSFKTILPGFYPADLGQSWYRPPHVHFMVAATGYPQFVTQMYFKGDMLPDNNWIQELNERDLLLQSPSLSPEERNRLIVNFEPSTAPGMENELIGNFNITLSR